MVDRSPALVKFANTLVNYSLDTKAGDILVARTSGLAVPLLREVYRAAILAGAHVAYHLGFEGEEEILYSETTDEQLEWVSPVERLEVETCTSRLTIRAPENTRTMSGLNSKRYAQR